MNGSGRPTWAEVNLRHVAHNVRLLHDIASPARLMAVVKANGYGHGAVPIARTALANGAACLAVATPEEGYELRKNGIAVPILVLSAIIPDQAPFIVDAGLTATVSSLETAWALSAAATARQRPVSVHLKVDTGMGRVGVAPEGAPAFFQAVSQLPNLRVEGIYSHFATADEPDNTYALRQLELFRQVLKNVRNTGMSLPTFHIANSAAIFNLPQSHFDMVRAGLVIYGLYPSGELKSRVTLMPAMSLKTRITQVRKLPAGSAISYGSTYLTSRETTIATLPIGYADGVRRGLSGKIDVLIHGRRFPQVGRICMDQCMVELGEQEAEVGDEVVLMGTQGEETITADEWADKLGTINYEIVTGISNRVPRKYT